MLKKITWLTCAVLLCALLTALPAGQAAVAAETVENVSTISFIGGTTTQEDIDKALEEGVISYTSEQIDGETVYTIKLLKNITMKAGCDVRIGEYRENGPALPQMILDLNGCTITSQSIGLINYGDLIIRDTSDAKTGTIKYSTTSDKSSLVAISHKGGLLEIEGGTFICESGYAFTGYVAAVSTQAGATTHIKGGTFVSNSSAVLSSGETVVYGGTFNAPYGMYAKSANGVPGTITIPEESTAVVNASSFALVIQRDNNCDGKISAAGGTYNASNIVGGVRSPDTVTAVSISGGTFSESPVRYTRDTVILSGGDYYVGTQANDVLTNPNTEEVTVLQAKGALKVADGIKLTNSTDSAITVNGNSIEPDGSLLIHDWEEFPAKAPTCTEAGHAAYWKCLYCGLMQDRNGNTLTAVPVIPATGHSYQNGVCTVCGAREDGPAPTPTPAPAAPPKTGDSAHPLLWSVLLLTALLGGGLLCTGLRKRFR